MEQNPDIQQDNQPEEESKEVQQQPEEKIQKSSFYQESEINDLLQSDTLATVLSDLNNISSKIVDADEYKKTIDLINNHLKELQSDNNQYRRYFDDLMPLIGKITTVEDLKKLEELLRKLLEEQDSNAQKKIC